MRKGLKSRVICGVLAAIVIFLLYWFMLPPLHPASPLFWTFIVLTLAVVLAAVSLPRLLAALAGQQDGLIGSLLTGMGVDVRAMANACTAAVERLSGVSGSAAENVYLSRELDAALTAAEKRVQEP